MCEETRCNFILVLCSNNNRLPSILFIISQLHLQVPNSTITMPPSKKRRQDHHDPQEIKAFIDKVMQIIATKSLWDEPAIPNIHLVAKALKEILDNIDALPVLDDSILHPTLELGRIFLHRGMKMRYGTRVQVACEGIYLFIYL